MPIDQIKKTGLTVCSLQEFTVIPREEMNMYTTSRLMTAILMAAVFMTSSVAAKALTDEEVENLVKRSYQYVAMARRGV